MTTVTYNHIVQPPCCNTRLSTPAYGSLNFSAKEFWTDGRTVDGLAPNDCGLRGCSCGSYFVLSQAEYFERVPLGATESVQAQQVSDEKLHELLALNVTNSTFQVAVRRRYWRYLNDPYRVLYREHRLEQLVTFPMFEITLTQRQNLNQLASLLAVQKSPNWQELAEVYRELGDRQAAQAALGELDGNTSSLSLTTQVLLDKGIQGPVRYRN